MDPQAGISLPKLTARQGEPPIVSKRLPLKVLVTLFFRLLTKDAYLVQLLVYLKTRRETPGLQGYYSCDEVEQNRILHDAVSESKKNSWGVTPENIARYVASGLTQVSDLNLAIGCAEDLLGLADLGKTLDPHIVAHLTMKKLHDAAGTRLMENRIAFPQQTAIGDELRKMRQNFNAPRPLTPDEIAAHHRAVGLAAAVIIEKKTQVLSDLAARTQGVMEYPVLEH